MYLLYVDESGSVDDPQSDYFVLSGVCVFERQTHWAEQELNTIATRFNEADPSTIEFHGNVMRLGKSEWARFKPQDRTQATVDVLSVLKYPHGKLKVFTAVIDKRTITSDDIINTAFEKLACAFDNYLAALFQFNKPQRGIIIFDKSTYEISIQKLSSVFKHVGHSNGKLRNFSEVPLFLDSKASRLIQLADMVAYWIYRKYSALDSRGFDLIETTFMGLLGVRKVLLKY